MTQPDDARLTKAAPEAAVTRGDVALVCRWVLTGLLAPETPSAGRASALLGQPLGPAPV